MSLGFDFDETTRPGHEAPAVRELMDPDPQIMLGKLAASCARTESAVRELTEASRRHESELRAMTQRGQRLTITAVIVLQALVQVLQQTGVLK